LDTNITVKIHDPPCAQKPKINSGFKQIEEICKLDVNSYPRLSVFDYLKFKTCITWDLRVDCTRNMKIKIISRSVTINETFVSQVLKICFKVIVLFYVHTQTHIFAVCTLYWLNN